MGAALEVRDRVVGAIQPWTSRPSAEQELNRVRRDVRRFERRGTVARNRVVRELRKRRNAVAPRAAQAPQRRGPLPEAAAQRRAAHDHDRTASTPRRRDGRVSVTEVEKAVKPQVDRVQKELQTQTKQARDRVQQFV